MMLKICLIILALTLICDGRHKYGEKLKHTPNQKQSEDIVGASDYHIYYPILQVPVKQNYLNSEVSKPPDEDNDAELRHLPEELARAIRHIVYYRNHTHHTHHSYVNRYKNTDYKHTQHNTPIINVPSKDHHKFTHHESSHFNRPHFDGGHGYKRNHTYFYEHKYSHHRHHKHGKGHKENVDGDHRRYRGLPRDPMTHSISEVDGLPTDILPLNLVSSEALSDSKHSKDSDDGFDSSDATPANFNGFGDNANSNREIPVYYWRNRDSPESNWRNYPLNPADIEDPHRKATYLQYHYHNHHHKHPRRIDSGAPNDDSDDFREPYAAHRDLSAGKPPKSSRDERSGNSEHSQSVMAHDAQTPNTRLSPNSGDIISESMPL